MREDITEKAFEEIMAENVPNLMKITNSKFQKAKDLQCQETWGEKKL